MKKLFVILVVLIAAAGCKHSIQDKLTQNYPVKDTFEIYSRKFEPESNKLSKGIVESVILNDSMSEFRYYKDSKIINSLINAAKNGKIVTVIIELYARFDEENNIYWANKLKEEGVNVIFGVPNLKVHSKLILITRKEKSRLVNYAHVGSGNFNEKTANLYTDISLLTADKRVAGEVAKVFEFFDFFKY